MLIAGVDEVGRGALAGPLIAVAAEFRCHKNPISGIKDSKKYTGKGGKRKRKEIFYKILNSGHLIDFGLGQIDAQEIDKIGITEANSLAFLTAIRDLKKDPDHILVDGPIPIEGIPIHKQTVESGADAKYWQVSAASILAKVIRDSLMEELSRLTTFDCWASCSGYGTKKHYEYLKNNPTTVYHRKTFLKKIIIKVG